MTHPDFRLKRRSLISGAASFALPTALHAQTLPTQTSPTQTRPESGAALRYGMSMADVPLTSGQPDRGAGAYQFTGFTLYDPLVGWEMNVADRPGKLIPGLATSWEVDRAEPRNWIFHLRQGVKFHDGAAFDADSVAWNLAKVLDPKAAHFDNRQAAQVRPRLPWWTRGVCSMKRRFRSPQRRWMRSSLISCSGS